MIFRNPHLIFSFLSIFNISDAPLDFILPILFNFNLIFLCKMEPVWKFKDHNYQMLVKLMWYVNYISFWKINFPQNVKKSINHKNDIWMSLLCGIKLMLADTKMCFGTLLFWKLKTFHEMALMECLYNYARDHYPKTKVFWFKSCGYVEN